MRISQKEVERMAQLARLKLSEQEKKQYSEELSVILEYFNQLKKVNTDKIEPTTQVTALQNIFREDKVREFTDRDKIKKQFPQDREGYLKVKSVFE